MLLLKLRSVSTNYRQRVLIQDIHLNGSTPLEVGLNNSRYVTLEMKNVTIWNATVDTYMLLANRVTMLSLTDCSVSQVFLLPSIQILVITNGNVTEIEVVDPYEIDNTKTWRIIVRNSSTRTLPTYLGKLVKLTEIHWIDNEVNALDLSIFNGFRNLKHIVFSGCSISKVPDRNSLQQPSLQFLELDHNRIAFINTLRWSMPDLMIINLDSNQLSQLPQLAQFHKLHTINLQNNLISIIDPILLETLGRLSVLLLANNSIILLDSWSSIHLPHLTHLDLNRNQLRNLDTSQWDMPKLYELRIEHNQLRTIGGFESIASTMQKFFFGANPWDCEWVHFAMVDLNEKLQLEWAESCQ